MMHQQQANRELKKEETTFVPAQASKFRLHRKFKSGICISAALIASLTCNSLVASASPESEALAREGNARLQQNQFRQALESFDAALIADPNETQAIFFQGVAFNRLGEFDKANERLVLAQQKGSVHPELLFELGWSLVGTKQWQPAITALEEYDKAPQKRGQTSEFIGRSYLALGEYDKAKVALQEAVRRDPKLRPTVRIYLNAAERRNSDLSVGQDQINELLQDSSLSSTQQALGEQIRVLSSLTPRLESALAASSVSNTTETPRHFYVSAGGGYNSNVIGLGEGAPLPSDISRESAAFASVGFGANYGETLSNKSAYDVGYEIATNLYNQVSDLNLVNHRLYGGYRQDLSPQVSASLRISDDFTQIDGSRFRNQFQIRPSLVHRQSTRSATELAVNASFSDYYFASSQVQNRDSNNYAVSLTQYLGRRGLGLRDPRYNNRLGIFRSWNQAKGSDFDFKSYGFFLGGRRPLGEKLTFDMSYILSFDGFDNPNSLTAFSSDRDDRSSALTLRLIYPIGSSTEVSLQGIFNRGRSNIDAFSYKQHIVSAGISKSF